ncbi:hypothetical protein RND81_12G019200 [Saponaria officinalis]|uniref:C2H2-type domain-containing protein n=2 Tax=Saponaria officinalis TaxID=3572 RepID=A0AAW1H451_SAPOF
MEGENGVKVPIFRDIRRYYCQFCGTCRSKKTLITKHILSEHPEEMKSLGEIDEKSQEKKGDNKCEVCGDTFKKPAHLKQHMLSHSFERPFVCPVDDCNASYRRKDHLNRHLIQHEGKLFKCPVENCNKEFTVHGNVARHVKGFHEGKPDVSHEEPKKHVCQKNGCGKEFKYASQLQKHEESHVESSEAFCADSDCLKAFSNRECLMAHMRSCHQYIICEVCGSKHLRKNYKRHLRSHDENTNEVLKCNFKGCDHSFTTSSNLRQHVKAVHLNLRPFACSFPGCGMTFAFKHVRDNHEKSFRHVHVEGDLEEFDERWRSRSRSHGGRKRKCPTVEMLMSKRVTPPNECDSVLNHSAEYLSWLLSVDD